MQYLVRYDRVKAQISYSYYNSSGKNFVDVYEVYTTTGEIDHALTGFFEP
ncbi:MAG: hypothetical protein HC906_18155 [Bacteroidales bacterium]|nr:hypothetical protein [Bacteroidales bacterium]